MGSAVRREESRGPQFTTTAFVAGDGDAVAFLDLAVAGCAVGGGCILRVATVSGLRGKFDIVDARHLDDVCSTILRMRCEKQEQSAGKAKMSIQTRQDE